MRGSTSFTGIVRGSSNVRAARISRTQLRYATTSMRMPAMSPTMTEGGIVGWKLKEGESFAAGDVLLEVETDKATIDVEAQDDGVMGKIVSQAGSSKIPVGQVIAILAEEGDDLASIEVPSDLAPEGSEPPKKSEPSSSASAPASPPKKSESDPVKETKPAESSSGYGGSDSQAVAHEAGHGHKEIKHSKPLFPSVSRLLLESDLTSEQISKLKGTGRHGMLTKGDVLLALGKLKNAFGSAEKLNLDVMGPSGRRASENKATSPTGVEPKKKEEPLDGPALRRLIVSGLSKATEPHGPIVSHEATPLPRSYDAIFDSVLAPYASLLPPPQPSVGIPSQTELAASEGHLSHAKKDEWAGLY